jgi:hypothetical protein
MGDPSSGGHQIHRARLDPLVNAEAVAVVDRSGEQIGDGRKVDMRVRPDVDALPGIEMRRPHLVEEDEGADHGSLLVRKRPVDLESAKVVSDGRERLEDEAIVHGRSIAAIAAKWDSASAGLTASAGCQ